MAKKITNPESETPEIPGTQSENPEQPTPTPEPPQETLATPEPAPVPKTEKKEPEKAQVQAIPEHADRILKTFRSYPELYIDAQGGTYTVDSPPMFHSNATLYKNPYHKN